jgi:predicted nuclease of predicted toxin-antitoxin system
MNIFVDENIPSNTVEELRALGHDVLDIRGTDKEGLDDEGIWDISFKQKRLVITTDKGFANHRDEKHSGILIVCLNQPNREKIHTRIMKAFSQYTETEWKGLLIMVRDTVQSAWKAFDEDENLPVFL